MRNLCNEHYTQSDANIDAEASKKHYGHYRASACLVLLVGLAGWAAWTAQLTGEDVFGDGSRSWLPATAAFLFSGYLIAKSARAAIAGRYGDFDDTKRGMTKTRDLFMSLSFILTAAPLVHFIEKNNELGIGLMAVASFFVLLANAALIYPDKAKNLVDNVSEKLTNKRPTN